MGGRALQPTFSPSLQHSYFSSIKMIKGLDFIAVADITPALSLSPPLTPAKGGIERACLGLLHALCDFSVCRTHDQNTRTDHAYRLSCALPPTPREAIC